MKTRSSSSNLRYERDSDSDEISYGRRLRKRNRIPLLAHRSRYGRALNLGMQIKFSEKSHVPGDMGREHQSNETLEKKYSPGVSTASHSSSSQPYINGDENTSEEKIVRRSTRQRKFIYDNLNQTWLLATGIPDFSKLESFLSAPQQSPVDGEECVQPRRSERNRNHESARLAINSDSMEYDDMYSRVKRKRRKSVHEFYTHESPQDNGSMADTEDTDRNGLSDTDSIADHSDIEEGTSICMGEVGVSQADGTVNSIKYSLRPKKPITERFQFPIEPVRPRRSNSSSLFDPPRHHRQPNDREIFKNNAHRSPLFRRKKHSIHHSSSSSSSSDDESRFEKTKARSMARARARSRCLPVNLIEEELTKGVLRDRMKIGTSLADIDPMGIDKSVSFDSIGGLDKHIQALKEMILFPLMYPEVFERFKITPPRGVLFHGAPGTGKTLVARALANECSNNDRKVAFFMRKGADCLSKWVGESERQLRLLFDQAYSMRPSIIFFDEIDGLAPVRSTRQDQIHSSIVSTLLALMDGLDNRGEVVIIGATNRIDAIDPALRRPGRFDREMLFPLPSNEARQKILKIHMQQWSPPQPDTLIRELAARSVGYCGADLKALCTEAALVALRRRYPQIYGSRQKLQLDVNSIFVTSRDFLRAMRRMKPSVQRSSVFSAKPLPEILKPLLESQFQVALSKLHSVFPVSPALLESCKRNSSSNRLSSVYEASSDESDSSFVEEPKTPNGPESERSRYLWPFVHRPRFLLCGKKRQGQGILAPALLYLMEHIPVHRLDIPSLYCVTCKAPEEACAQIFQEAQRNLPSIIFLPHIGYWWETLSDTVRATFLSLLQDLEPYTPVLLLATSDYPLIQLPTEVRDIFSMSDNQVLHMWNPSEENRSKFFSRLMKEVFIPPRKRVLMETVAEPLPVAPTPTTRQLSELELEKLRQKEEATLRELRLFLRDILNKLARDRRFYIFARPVDPDEVPDYKEVIKNPMDLETMMTKIDLHKYETVSEFLSDIDLVCQNALEYNPDRDPSDKLIRHRACALKDIAHALVLSELDDEFEKICQDIHNSRKERGESKQQTNSNVLSKTHSTSIGMLVSTEAQTPNQCVQPLKQDMDSTADGCPTRFSKRIRGLGTLSECGDEDETKKENFPVPRRASRYIIWRKKKSPWFGGCRRKLIRRSVKTTSDGLPRKKFKKSNKFLKFKASQSLSPIHESPKLAREKVLSISPEKELKPESSPNDKSPNDKSPGIATNMPMPSEDVGEKDVTNVSPTKKTSPKTKLEKNIDSATSACDAKINSCDIFIDNMCSKECSTANDTASHGPNDTESEKDATVKATTVASPEATKRTSTSEPELTTAKQEVIVDREALQSVFDRVVKVTRDCTVETLQHMFSTLHCCIYRHRKELNKQDLLLDLEEELRRFLQQKLS